MSGIRKYIIKHILRINFTIPYSDLEKNLIDERKKISDLSFRVLNLS